MTQNPAPEIAIAMAFDTFYAPHAASVIASITRHASTDAIRYLIMQSGIDAATRAKVESCAPRARFDWIDIDESMFPEMADRGHINRTTLYRLGLARIAPPDLARLIYLDSDLTICADIAELWRTDLDGKPLGAVLDPGQDAAEFAARWRLAGAHGYFNAGVLLIDLEAARAARLFDKALAFQIEHGPTLPWNDQDSLNWAAWGNWRALAPAWNVQRVNLLEDVEMGGKVRERLTRAAPWIVHYTTEHKPWLPQSWHPWAWLYWDNLARTPFFRDVAARHGFDRAKRFKAWARWMLRRPS